MDPNAVGKNAKMRFSELYFIESEPAPHRAFLRCGYLDDTSSWVGLPTDDVRCESARRTATRLPMSLIEDAGQLQRITDALKQSSMLETGPPSRSELAASGHGKHVLLAKMSRSNYIPGKRHLSCSEGRRSLIGKAELEIKYCVT